MPPPTTLQTIGHYLILIYVMCVWERVLHVCLGSHVRALVCGGQSLSSDVILPGPYL